MIDFDLYDEVNLFKAKQGSIEDHHMRIFCDRAESKISLSSEGPNRSCIDFEVVSAEYP